MRIELIAFPLRAEIAPLVHASPLYSIVDQTFLIGLLTFFMRCDEESNPALIQSYPGSNRT